MDYKNLITIEVDSDLRTINIPNDGIVFGVVGDVHVNRVCFHLPRYYRGLNMDKCLLRFAMYLLVNLISESKR